MGPSPNLPLSELAAAATEVAEGDYESAKKIFEFTKPGAHTPEFQAAAEAFGMMAVKVEAREFRLERALAEIRRANDQLEEASRSRVEFGTMASFIIIVLSMYTMALSFMQNVVKVDINLRRAAVEIVSLTFLVLQIAMALLFVMKHKPKPEAYGWTMRGWKRSIGESLVFSALLFLVMVAVKWVVSRVFAGSYPGPLVDWSYWGGWVTVTSYLFIAPAQEVIGRGFLQTSIERFLTGPRRTLLAIALTSVQFGVVHVHFSFETGLLAMLSGVIFGLIFARHRTLVGVSICHYIVGTLAFGPLRLLGV